MKHNINKIVTLLPIAACLFLFGCSKGSEGNRPNGSEPTLEDSVALLSDKWKLIKDSSTNIGDYYFIENGTAYYPTPGVYFGQAEDYFYFGSNGMVEMHANNQTYTDTYKLYAGSKLGIGDTVHGAAKVITLTTTDATFDLSNTSPNGGKYFRRTYLKK